MANWSKRDAFRRVPAGLEVRILAAADVRGRHRVFVPDLCGKMCKISLKRKAGFVAEGLRLRPGLLGIALIIEFDL